MGIYVFIYIQGELLGLFVWRLLGIASIACLISKIYRGLIAIVDLCFGLKTDEVVFRGIGYVERLDWFYKVQYASVTI